ncbi:hypothetical protein FRB91_005984 [Serendipita sp. 411]|nr:hypothetical protein FRB91_005984 [Serendipita sp. 411]
MSSKLQPAPPSRPHSATSSTRSGKTSTRGRFFRPVPYSTTLALQQLMDGGSDTSHATRPTPVQRGSVSSGKARYKTPSSASTRRDQIQSEVGKGHNLPVVDEQGQVWLDWEEKQEFTGLMEDHANGGDDENGWVGFPSPDGGRESDEESTMMKNRPYDPSSRQLLEAFTFSAPSSSPAAAAASTSASASTHRREEMVAPDQQLPMTRPRGTARIRRVKTSESLRAGSAPIVIPPIPSAHHPMNHSSSDAMQEFVDASFHPPSFDSGGTKDPSQGFAKRASISLKGFAKKLVGNK